MVVLQEALLPQSHSRKCSHGFYRASDPKPAPYGLLTLISITSGYINVLIIYGICNTYREKCRDLSSCCLYLMTLCMEEKKCLSQLWKECGSFSVQTGATSSDSLSIDCACVWRRRIGHARWCLQHSYVWRHIFIWTLTLTLHRECILMTLFP